MRGREDFEGEGNRVASGFCGVCVCDLCDVVVYR